MRALALALILANLGFLAWTQLIDVRESPTPSIEKTPSETKQRLMLASERKAQQAVSADHSDTVDATIGGATTEGAAANVQQSQCVSLGPFQDLAAASQASAALSGAGFESKQRFEQGEFWVGYWVSVQDLTTRSAADAALVKLKDAGISDAYVLPGAASSTILSLGVYSDLGRAERRVDQIRSLGLNAVMADRKRTGSVYWLDVSLAHAGQHIDPAVLRSQPGQIIRIETRPCPTSEAAPTK